VDRRQTQEERESVRASAWISVIQASAKGEYMLIAMVMA
jgi:hypothetical protein